MPAHRTTTDEPAVDDASSDTCMFIGSFRQIERKERPKRVPWDVRPPFDVSWCCVTGFYRPELVESVNQSERTRGRWTCEPVAAPFYFLNLKTMAGCRWKKSNERDREKKMHGPLLIHVLAFLSRGGGGGGGETRGNFPKQRLAEVCLARSPITTKKKKLHASCPALWMKFTTTKTRWQISPDLDLCPVKSSSLIQAQKGRKKRSLSCRGRAAKFPSCGIISKEMMPLSCIIS